MSLETIRLGELALNKESLLLDVGSGEGRHSISAHLISDAVIFGLDANHDDLLTAKSRLDEFQISAQKKENVRSSREMLLIYLFRIIILRTLSVPKYSSTWSTTKRLS